MTDDIDENAIPTQSNETGDAMREQIDDLPFNPTTQLTQTQEPPTNSWGDSIISSTGEGSFVPQNTVEKQLSHKPRRNCRRSKSCSSIVTRSQSKREQSKVQVSADTTISEEGDSEGNADS